LPVQPARAHDLRERAKRAHVRPRVFGEHQQVRDPPCFERAEVTFPTHRPCPIARGHHDDIRRLDPGGLHRLHLVVDRWAVQRERIAGVRGHDDGVS
jgi:hypothetical protein